MNLTLEQLQAKYPELYSEILGRGILLERRRVLAHLDTASTYHVLEEATEEVRKGSPSHPVASLHDLYSAIEDKHEDDLEAYRKECAASGCRSWL